MMSGKLKFAMCSQSNVNQKKNSKMNEVSSASSLLYPIKFSWPNWSCFRGGTVLDSFTFVSQPPVYWKFI